MRKWFVLWCLFQLAKDKNIERFYSRDYWPYWFTATKESICIEIEFNFQGFSLGHQHGRHFFHSFGTPQWPL